MGCVNNCAIWSQAYGAKSFKLVGLFMQRAMLLCILVALPIVTLYHNTQPILLSIGLPLDVAEGTARYLFLFSPVRGFKQCTGTNTTQIS